MRKLLLRLSKIADDLPQGTVALSDENRDVTYSALITEVKKRMEWLKDIETHVLAIQSGNSVEWVLIDLACQALDVVVVPLPEFFSSEQVSRCVSVSGVDTIISDKPICPMGSDESFQSVAYCTHVSLNSNYFAWKSILATQPEIPVGTQKITFTSGSTGSPKGVCLSREHQWRVAESLATVVSLKRPVHLCVLPLGTLLENVAGVYAPLLCGGRVVVVAEQQRGMIGSSRVDANALLSCISEIQPDSIILVPQLLLLLVNACETGWSPPSSLKFIAVGGGRVAISLITKARESGLPIYQGYGLSECGSVVSLNTFEQDQVQAAGKILPHCQIKIVDGEIVVSGASFLGYLGQKESWYPEEVKTGDIGSVNEGFLTINGRRKNLLVSSYGRNIHPEWVESNLLSNPFIRWCVVAGEAKPYLTAIISASKDVSNTIIQYWIDTCNQSLPDYARVRGWLRVDDCYSPKYLTANGRVKREEILADFVESLEKLYAESNTEQIGIN